MPFPRTPQAARSRLGLAWHCVRRGRADVCAEQDCIELGVELGKPRVLFLQLLGFFPQLFCTLLKRVALHFHVYCWMPI